MSPPPPSPRPEAGSPLEDALGRVGDRWSLLIVDALLAGPQRFNELLDALEGLAPNVLSQRLKHLEKEAIVLSRPYSRRPLRLEYELTGIGRELAGALRLLAHWGSRASGEVHAPRHSACGTPMEARWYCPTCGRSVADDEPADLRFL
ncbi:MAG: winged helix-turn-helix transcriptional regulator [Actinomycetota bacterium]